MSDEESNDRTIQMSPEALAKLHAELAGKRNVSAREAETVLSDNTLEVDHTAIPQRAKPAVLRAPAPAPAPVKSTSGGGLLVVGGIGAILAGLGPALLTLTMVQGMGRDLTFMIAGLLTAIVGHLLTSIGMFGAVSRSNGVAALVGTFHVLTALGLALFLLSGLKILKLDMDIVLLVPVISGAVLGASWLLSAIWAFSSTRSLGGAMASLHGVFALLGGGAVITLTIATVSEMFRRSDDDLAIMLVFGGAGSILLASVFLAVAKFGRLRSASH